MIRQEANIAAAVDRASPRSTFMAVSWAGLPLQIQQAMAGLYGDASKAIAGLSAKNPPLLSVFATYAMTIRGDAAAATAWVATAPRVWQLCMTETASAIVDGEAAPLVKLIANGHLSAAAADGWESQRKAAAAIAAGATASAKGLQSALQALNNQIATAKQGATDLFDAWRGKVPANYMALATDSVQTYEAALPDPKFLQPLLKPDPLARGAFDPALPEPYQAGFRTAKNPAPFSPRVTFLSGGQQLAPKQRILPKLDPKAVAAWNDAVRPAIQTLLDLLWLYKEAQTQEGWQVQSAAIYTKKVDEFAANTKTQADLSAKVKADAAEQIAKLPAFAAAVVASAGLKLGNALAAAKYAEDAYAIQKLAIVQTDHTNMLTRFQQALQAVKIKADGLASDVAAQLQAISAANIPAAEGLQQAGQAQADTAGKGVDAAKDATKPPANTIDAAVNGTDTGKAADGMATKAGNQAGNMQTNGQAIDTTNQNNADQLQDPGPVEPEPERSGNWILPAIGFGILAKLLLR